MPVSILVRHAMTEAPKTLGPGMSAADAAALMSEHDVGAIPVASEQDGLVGVVTDRDIVIRVVAKGLDPRTTPLADVATEKVVTVSPDERLSDARDLMAEQKIRRLLVVKNDALVGILSVGDVAWADASARTVGETLKQISASESTSQLNEGPDQGTPDRVRGTH